jgi:predicted signal transduction protein with EAL and GGDEF domain
MDRLKPPDGDPRPTVAELEQRLQALDVHARELERDLAQSRERLAADEAQCRELAAEAERARNVDPASGLPNLAAFVRELERMLAGQRLQATPAAVLAVGIDRLATVREALGFGTADEVAQRIGERLREAILPWVPVAEAQGDAGAAGPARSALIARVGDDEFALALLGARAVRDAPAVARRLIEAIDGPMRVAGSDLRLMATVGVALPPEDGSRADILLSHAQAAMRYARERGGHLYEFFRVSIGQEGARRLRTEADLRGAIDRGEISVDYQPRLRLRSRRIVGVEALVRWNHPERGRLVAADFIGTAVETGLITLIGEVVLRQACRDAVRWPRHVALSVNLSAREFRGTRLETIIDRALAESGLAPGRLLVELTEAGLLGGDGDDPDIALVRLTALRERGVQLILDNFGARFGGVDLIRRCRPDGVKVSAHLVRGLGVDDEALAVVRAIAGVARHFGATVIAEGIEHEAQLAGAIRAGCTQGQGYHLGAPVAAEEFGAALRDKR